MDDRLKRLGVAGGGWNPTDYSKRLLVPEEKIIIYSDMHIPYHDPSLFCKMLDEAESRKSEAIVFLGDTWDMKKFSNYGDDTPNDSFRVEQTIGKEVIKMALEVVQTVYISLGNHDLRWIRHNKYHVDLFDLVRMMGIGDDLTDPEEGPARVIVSNSPALDAAGGRVMLVHPERYGATPLVEPARLVSKYHQSVIAAHAHHAGMVRMKIGNEHFFAVESGGGFKAEYFQYVQYHVSSLREMIQGYVVLEGENVTLRY